MKLVLDPDSLTSVPTARSSAKRVGYQPVLVLSWFRKGTYGFNEISVYEVVANHDFHGPYDRMFAPCAALAPEIPGFVSGTRAPLLQRMLGTLK